MRLLAVATAFIAASSMAEAEEPRAQMRELGVRLLPPPAGASEQMRELIAEFPSTARAPSKVGIPQTKEEWSEWAEKNNARAAAGALSTAKEFGVTIKQETIAGVEVYRLQPPAIDPAHKNHLFVFLHGGAYVLGAKEAGLGEAILVATQCKIPVLSIDYRMPPNHPAPVAIEDVAGVWQALLKEHASTSMAMGGSSSGGGLVLAALHYFKEYKIGLPGALYIGTPAVDVDKTGDSRYINEGADRLLASWDGVVQEAFSLYAGKYDHKHPYVSPIYGDFRGFPPSYLISGTRDLLLSDTVRTHQKMRTANVEADLHIYEGLSHREYTMVTDAPEFERHFGELNRFLLRFLH